MLRVIVNISFHFSLLNWWKLETRDFLLSATVHHKNENTVCKEKYFIYRKGYPKSRNNVKNKVELLCFFVIKKFLKFNSAYVFTCPL